MFKITFFSDVNCDTTKQKKKMNKSDALNYYTKTPIELCDARRDFANGNYLLDNAARSLDATTRLRVLERCFLASLVAAGGVDVSSDSGDSSPMRYLREISREFPMFTAKYDAVESQRVVESLDTVYCVETTPIASFRTLLLHGQLLEARQQFEQAFKLYEFARERNPNNSTLVVRQVCVLRQVFAKQRRRRRVFDDFKSIVLRGFLFVYNLDEETRTMRFNVE